jgi:nucleoside-diphosphate-sugar epimerase
MRILITGSSGHLGEALVRELGGEGHDVVGLDILSADTTTVTGSISDRGAVRRAIEGMDAVIHAATLHKPHVATHSKQKFVDTNITGTLTLLEEAVRAEVSRFVFTSTTSSFGNALRPEQPNAAVWVTEDLAPIPRNIYGVTKTAAEDICQLVAEEHGLPCVVLRTSRFFPEADDMKHTMDDFADANIKANEYLYRRVDIADVVSAHRCALERAPQIGFGRFIISATTPFRRDDCNALIEDAPAVVSRDFPDYEDVYARIGWKMFRAIGRVYVNDRAREQLGWSPRYDFAHVIESLRTGESPLSPLARAIGSKGYH